MWRGGAETPTWRKGRRYALHHALVAGHLAYGAWRDGGLTVLDVAEPTRPRLLAHRNWDPPFGGGTHSPLPLPERDLLVVADEPTTMNCSQGLRYVWMFDVREPGEPGQHRHLPLAVRGGLLPEGRQLRPAQPPREPARLVPELAPDLRHVLQRGRARLRHREPVPAARGRLLRAGRPDAPDRSPAEPAAGDPVQRLLRRPERPHVPDRQQRRPQHPRVRRAREHLAADRAGPPAPPGGHHATATIPARARRGPGRPGGRAPGLGPGPGQARHRGRDHRRRRARRGRCGATG